MHFKTLTIALVATLMRSVSASPLSRAEDSGLVLWNGNENVVSKVATTGRISQSTNTTADPGLLRRGNIDCSGTFFCNTLSGVNGDRATAMRLLVSTNIYQTDGDAGSTGVCKGSRGIFVKGDHCQASGAQLIDA